MSEINSQFNSILTSPTAEMLVQMLDADMVRYTDPATGGVRAELATNVPLCPACGTASPAAAKLTKGPFAYAECAKCGLVYVNPRLNDTELNYLYSEGRCRVQMEKFYLPTAEFRAAKLYPPKLEYLEQRATGRELLDFGSSTGYFLKEAIARGWNASGIELNPFAVKWSREQLGITSVYHGFLADAPFRPGQFSAITLWDVLEHLPDPVAILAALRELLAPDGVMVIETSRYDCVETELLGVENTNFVGDMHLMHFTPGSLDALAQRSGLTVGEWDSFGLDLAHAVSHFARAKDGSLQMPAHFISVLQGVIDRANEGCYLRAVLRRAG